MPDDWSWFWASEQGRDRMLRDEIEGLQSAAYSARSQSARLSSQLRTLQGSLETRLQALSAAFDAYVELGDVRQELAGYPDSSAVRRDVLRAVEELSRGVRARHVDGRDLGYWLADAVNALIDVLADRDAGQVGAAAPLPADAELFVVAAAGALDQGPRVNHRLAPLLVADGPLSASQVVLWSAARDGVYGDVLDQVGEVWQPALDLSADTWRRWAREAARAADPLSTLRWLSAVAVGPPPPPSAKPEPEPEPAHGQAQAQAAGAPRLEPLRHLVRDLVDAGYGDERALLTRARVLRARIEDPTGLVPDPETAALSTATPTTEVQRALLDPATEPVARTTLLAWVRPGLEAAARQLGEQDAVTPVPITTVRTAMGDVDVTPDGPDPTRLGRIEAAAAEQYATPRSAWLVPAVAAGVLLVGGGVMLATRAAGLGLLVLAGAVAAGVVLVRRVLAQRERRTELAQVRERTTTQLADGRRNAEAVRRARLDSRAESATLVRELTGAPEPRGGPWPAPGVSRQPG